MRGSPLPVGPPPEFQVELAVFEGPLPLLLHLIESAELDILTVPLATVADAYVAYLATHPVDAVNLAQFVATAAQLILIKSRRLLPAGADSDALTDRSEDVDEEELRRRLIAYRAIRDAARELAARDFVAPMWRREPRDADLPEAPLPPLAPALLAEALARLAVGRRAGAGAARDRAPGRDRRQQIAVLRAALGREGKVVLQAILAAGSSRTERVVTLMAPLELVRRRELRAKQTSLFGPIVLEATRRAGA